MLTTTKQRQQVQSFIKYIERVFDDEGARAQRQHWEVAGARQQDWIVALVHGRVIISYTSFYAPIEQMKMLRVAYQLLNSTMEAAEDLRANGINPVILNVVFPAQLGKTVSCEFVIDEPSIIIDMLKATQHNLAAVTCAEGLLPLKIFRDMLEKALRVGDRANPLYKIFR